MANFDKQFFNNNYFYKLLTQLLNKIKCKRTSYQAVKTISCCQRDKVCVKNQFSTLDRRQKVQTHLSLE